MKKNRSVNVMIRHKGKNLEISLFLEYPNPCTIIATLPEKNNLTVFDDDFFSCLAELREKLPNTLFLCKGAKINVYPSRISRQMGYGLKAYECELGKQATFENLVDIFNFEDKELSQNVKEQIDFHQRWLNSLSI